MKKQKLNFEYLKLINNAINRPLKPSKIKLEGKKKQRQDFRNSY